MCRLPFRLMLMGFMLMLVCVTQLWSRDNDPARITVLAHHVSWHIQGSPGWQEASILPVRHGSRVGEGYTAVDPAIIREQNAEFLEYGVTPLTSWWGIGHYAGDVYLDAYLSVPSSVKSAILYEVVGLLKKRESGVGDIYDMDDQENQEKFISDIVHLHERYFSRHPERFVRIDGRPVVFIWLSGLFTGDFEFVANRVRERVPVYLIGSDVGIFGPPRDDRLPVIRGMDAESAYGTYWPDIAREHKGHFDAAFTAKQAAAFLAWSAWLHDKAPRTMLIPPLMFSFDDSGVPGRPNNPPMISTPEEAAYLAGMVRQLISDGYHGCSNILPLTLFVSYNEHYEGSSLEASVSNPEIQNPPRDIGWEYLNVIRSVFGPPIAEMPRTCSPF